MDIYIDNLIRKLVEIRKDGYHYCSINTITGDDEFCGLLSVLAAALNWAHAAKSWLTIISTQMWTASGQ